MRKTSILVSILLKSIYFYMEKNSCTQLCYMQIAHHQETNAKTCAQTTPTHFMAGGTKNFSLGFNVVLALGFIFSRISAFISKTPHQALSLKFTKTRLRLYLNSLNAHVLFIPVIIRLFFFVLTGQHFSRMVL